MTIPLLLPQASSAAAEIDLLYFALNLNAFVFTLIVAAIIVVLAVRYRRGVKVDRSNPPSHSTLIEIIWTVIPSIIAIGLFGWAVLLFLAQRRMPAGAMEIHVVGKQWMWKLQQPNGRWEMNELHVPVGRTVKLIMTSEDVGHSFFVPAFRTKQDVFPGQFSYLWFTPTRLGTYHLFCAEYCGTLHSKMVGEVTVMDPKEYEDWLSQGNVEQTVAAEGARLFRRRGCFGCHGAGAAVRAPALEGIFGRQVPVQIPPPGQDLAVTPATTITVDNRYLYDSIVLPEREVAAGFKPIMPTFKNRLKQEEILKLIAYLRSLRREDSAVPVRQDNSENLTAEDYEARTGFVPKNIPGLKPSPDAAGGTGGRAATRTGSH